MKKINFIICLLVAVCAGCQDDNFSSSSDLIIQLQATDVDPATRVSVLPESGGLNLLAKFSAGDRFLTYATDGKTYQNLGSRLVENISDDGKNCRINVGLPNYLTMEHCSLYGINSKEIGFFDGEVRFSASLVRSRWGRFDAPVWFSSSFDYLDNFNSTYLLKCHHLGTYEILHVKNTSNKSIVFKLKDFDATPKWYYENAAYAPNSDKIIENAGAEDDKNLDEAVLAIDAGHEESFISWYIPNGNKIKDATLVATIDGNIVRSSNKKSSDVTLQRGHAYHMYATWDGKELKFGKNADLWGELKLSSYSVKFSEGSSKEISILNGSKKKDNITFLIGNKNIITGTEFVGNGTFRLLAGKAGQTAVTVTDEAEKLRAVIDVEVIDDAPLAYPECPDDHHPHFIELGLPSGTKWACCNVGANKPQDCGNYFAWGEITSKTNFSWMNYTWCKGTYTSLTKYCTKDSYGNDGFTDNLVKLNKTDDAANHILGNSYRMPTKAEWDELIANCKWREFNNGMLVSTTKDGKTISIFLPAAGYRCGVNTYDDVEGYYWSSTLDKISPDDAFFMNFVDGTPYVGSYFRCFGRSIRPVMNK